MLEAARKVQKRILTAQSSDPKAATMATTLTAIAFLDQKLVGVHVGDTRAAISRNDGIKKLTVDHSEGQRLFAAGKLTKDELASYPRQHILESALGEPGEPKTDGFEFDIHAGDKVVITSDGVHGVVFLREIREVLASTNSPDEACNKLKNAVEKRGPKDNYSAALIFVETQ
jgi:protein phosphatase